MATKKNSSDSKKSVSSNSVASSVEDLLLSALERGNDNFETGRFLVTFKEEAIEEGIKALGDQQGMRVASARDFDKETVAFESVGDADAVVFPEIGVALIGEESAQERNMSTFGEIASDSPIEAIEPERFVFAENFFNDYMQSETFAQSGEGSSGEPLRSAARILEAIAKEIYGTPTPQQFQDEEGALVLGATWGLNACRVPLSARSGAGIKVAVLDTGMDLGHPDFAGRPIISNQFVGQPVQDLNGHGTHCIGTACGPKSPPGTIPRYGIGYQSSICVGKVLRNNGWSVDGSVMAGMDWAVNNRFEIISMSLGGPGGPDTAYTNAGQRALNRGLLMIAAAGNGYGAPTGAPANSPTIMSVASLDSNLRPSAFSNRGKIDIAAPGGNIFSSWFRPLRYKTISGTSMATPHVSGCAALWAQTSPNLRGLALWNKLRQTARRLPFPATQVGAGLVQAP